jgi:hypothetical protein
MSRTKKIALTVVASIVALLWFGDEYPRLRFRGDAKFPGGSVFGYEIKMNQGGGASAITERQNKSRKVVKPSGFCWFFWLSV